ncbi:MAG: HNH endonuclease [Bacteroidetes bacterium]|nr:MAG: HNH endonuclease [Bacteroidota bacterium]
MTEHRISEKVRLQIHIRAHGCCEYCQSHDKWATQRFVAEHIIPKSKGGKTTLGNLALACPGCNSHKYNITEAEDPLSKKIVPIFHPRKYSWRKHFIWNEDFTHIVGLTPTGRATVLALKLNRPRLVNRRKAFYLLGLHPPEHSLKRD